MPAARSISPLTAKVEIEEDIYSFTPAENGANPLWCHGNTTLARLDDQVFATGLETIPGAKPLNNCRWTLWRRGDRDQGWQKIYTDAERTREPSPLAVDQKKRIFVSANPTRTPPDEYGGPAEPQILEFDGRQPALPPIVHRPRWLGEPLDPWTFTEHSYRSFAADGRRGEMLLLQNSGHKSAFWSFRGAVGAASVFGELVWPWGAEYAKPEPIRICYPNVALVKRAAYVCGVSDIVEPNPAFREFKFQLTGSKWDYDFRRLFFTWTPDITRQPFREWTEIASREATCGWVQPCDLRAEDDELVHLLWHEKSCDVRLREKFFPGTPLTISLEYALVREGKVLRRRTLARQAEGARDPIPLFARFHPAQDGRLLVVAGFQDKPEDPAGLRNRIFEIGVDGAPGEMTALDLKRPFKSFFTATPRAGSKPSAVLDLLGMGAGKANTVQYARVRLA